MRADRACLIMNTQVDETRRTIAENAELPLRDYPRHVSPCHLGRSFYAP